MIVMTTPSAISTDCPFKRFEEVRVLLESPLKLYEWLGEGSGRVRPMDVLNSLNNDTTDEGIKRGANHRGLRKIAEQYHCIQHFSNEQGACFMWLLSKLSLERLDDDTAEMLISAYCGMSHQEGLHAYAMAGMVWNMNLLFKRCPLKDVNSLHDSYIKYEGPPVTVSHVGLS